MILNDWLSQRARIDNTESIAMPALETTLLGMLLSAVAFGSAKLVASDEVQNDIFLWHDETETTFIDNANRLGWEFRNGPAVWPWPICWYNLKVNRSEVIHLRAHKAYTDRLAG